MHPSLTFATNIKLKFINAPIFLFLSSDVDYVNLKKTFNNGIKRVNNCLQHVSKWLIQILILLLTIMRDFRFKNRSQRSISGVGQCSSKPYSSLKSPAGFSAPFKKSRRGSLSREDLARHVTRTFKRGVKWFDDI